MDNPVKIYLLLTRTGTLFSRFLGLFEKQKYIHVSLGLDEELSELYSYGRRYLYFPLLSGFVKEDPEGPIYGHFTKAVCKVSSLEITKEQYEKLLHILDDFKMNRKKTRYGFINLIFMNFHLSYPRKYRLVCSQFVGKALAEAGILPPQTDCFLMRAMDFDTLSGLSPEYEGLLCEYRSSLNKSQQKKELS